MSYVLSIVGFGFLSIILDKEYVMGFHPLEILVLLTTAFWLWMLIDCLFNKSLRGTQKVLWLLLIFFTHMIGAIVYFIIGRSKKNVASQLPQGALIQESQSCQPYSQGYHAQQMSPQSGIQPTPPAQPIYEQYEQPRAAYPEPPQQDAP